MRDIYLSKSISTSFLLVSVFSAIIFSFYLLYFAFFYFFHFLVQPIETRVLCISPFPMVSYSLSQSNYTYDVASFESLFDSMQLYYHVKGLLKKINKPLYHLFVFSTTLTANAFHRQFYRWHIFKKFSHLSELFHSQTINKSGYF